MINKIAQTPMKTKNTIEAILYVFSSSLFAQGIANRQAKSKMARTPKTSIKNGLSFKTPVIAQTKIAAITKIPVIATDDNIL